METLVKQIMVSQIVLWGILNLTACTTNENGQEIAKGPAVVTGVSVTGSENNYTFSITLLSPDTGCSRYANWWEVISEDGTVLNYRRILAHSHVEEQPFTRSGGNVSIEANTEVIVRGHMHPTGYGNGQIVMKGSVANGFQVFEVPEGFGSNLENSAPQPSDCPF